MLCQCVKGELLYLMSYECWYLRKKRIYTHVYMSFKRLRQLSQWRLNDKSASSVKWLCLRVAIGDCAHTLTSEAYSSLEAPAYSAPPDHLLFWNVYIVSCVWRQADIGPPIIGYSVVREKSLFIGPLSGGSVRLALETFLTWYVARVIFVYVSKAAEWWRKHERQLLKHLRYTKYKKLRFVFTMCLSVLKPLMYI